MTIITIEQEKMNDVFIKHHLKGLPFDAVIHHFSARDKNDHIHDHPFGFTSHVLKGSYIERVYTIDEDNKLWYVKKFIEDKENHTLYLPVLFMKL